MRRWVHDLAGELYSGYGDGGEPGVGDGGRGWWRDVSRVGSAGYGGGFEWHVRRGGQTPDLLMAKDANGYWAGFVASAGEGDSYRFYVVGEGSSGYKRDPYARELANDPALPFPVCAAVIRGATQYPWHDAGFRAPDYSDMVVYQLHIGTYDPASRSQRVDGGRQTAAPGWAGTFLDVVMKIEYLVALGVNVVQPLPVYEMEDSPSQGYPGLGYQGSDLYSPAIDYAVYHETNPVPYLKTINRLLAVVCICRSPRM